LRATAAPSIAYSVTDLGTLGGSSSRANAINNYGVVVGAADTAAGTPHAVVWQNGQVIDLGTGPVNERLDNPNIRPSSAAYDINDAGEVVGYADFPSDGYSGYAYGYARHAVRWEAGVLTDLGTAGATNSVGYGINDAGQVVGIAASLGGSGKLFTDPVRWDDAGATRLAELPNDWFGAAYAINSTGQAVGRSDSMGGGSKAIRWNNDTLTDLGAQGSAADINTAGSIVGVARTVQGDQHAALWRNDTLTALGTLPDDVRSEATAVNNSEQVVGQSYAASGTPRPFIWDNGTLYELNSLLPSNDGWTLTAVTDINDRGQIVGTATVNGQQHAVLLTPALAAYRTYLPSVQAP